MAKPCPKCHKWEVLRCRSCGSVGCYTDGCENQVRKGHTCTKCGSDASNQFETID